MPRNIIVSVKSRETKDLREKHTCAMRNAALAGVDVCAVLRCTGTKRGWSFSRRIAEIDHGRVICSGGSVVRQ